MILAQVRLSGLAFPLSQLANAPDEVARFLRAKPEASLGSMSLWLPDADKGMHNHMPDGLRRVGLRG
jgi:hypothetical protein